jgi:acyl-CoA reductase-like NAD-dependent aldehyde dehydrogenase
MTPPTVALLTEGWDRMSDALQSFLSGRWQLGEGVETDLRNPITGEVLAVAPARNLGLASALKHAREVGGPTLQELTYGHRAKLLNATRDPGSAKIVHEMEIFGPVATLLSFHDAVLAFALVKRGGGSLVGSIFASDPSFLTRATQELASAHGRILAVDPTIANSHSGHGIVMPQCNHGGPGRTGNGEELGGLHGLRFYQRVAVQGSTDLLSRLQPEAAPIH